MRIDASYKEYIVARRSLPSTLFLLARVDSEKPSWLKLQPDHWASPLDKCFTLVEIARHVQSIRMVTSSRLSRCFRKNKNSMMDGNGLFVLMITLVFLKDKYT